jgi:lia operon protein LiaG
MKKTVLSLVVLFVIGVVGTLVSVSASGGFSLDTYDIGDKVVVENKDISHIEIDISSTDLSVLPTTDDEIIVGLKGKVSKKLKEKLELDVQESGKTLRIGLSGEDQIKLNIGVLIVDTSVEVLLPQKIYDSIKIDTSSGDIALENLKIKESMIEASSGDILINNFASPKSYFRTSSGEIELFNVTGDIKAEASSGDIFIEHLDVNGNINANTSSGDITIKYVETPTSLAIDFNGSSGEAEIMLDGINYEEKSEHAIRGKIGSGKFKVYAETSSGDFYLK